MNTKKVFILSGASGSGQDTLIEALAKEMPITRVITTTTRTIRPGESDGHPYHFISQEAFARLRNQGAFIECAQTYNSEWYGVQVSDLEAAVASDCIVIWKVDFQGVRNIKQKFPSIKSLFIDVSEDTLRKRLIKRDRPTQEYLDARMRYIEEWLSHKDAYDYIIKNEDGKLEEAVQNIKAIIEESSSS